MAIILSVHVVCKIRYLPLPKQPELESNVGSPFSWFWLSLHSNPSGCIAACSTSPACLLASAYLYKALWPSTVYLSYKFSVVDMLCLDFTYFFISFKIFLVSAYHWWKNFLAYCTQPWFPACSLVLLAYWFHRFETRTIHCAPKQKNFLRLSS